MVNNTKTLIILLATIVVRIGTMPLQTANAQQLSLSMAFTDSTICEGDTINQVITFTGNPPFRIVSDYPYTIPPLNNKVWKIPNLSESIEVTITEFSDADTVIADTSITFSLKVAPAVSVAINGGGNFCKSDTNILPIRAYFEGTSPWTFVYMVNDSIEKKRTVDSNRYTFPSDESITIEPLIIKDKHCQNYNIRGVKRVLSLNGAPTPVINGPNEVCVGEKALYDTKAVNNETKFSWIINSGAESLEVINAHYRNIKWIESGTHTIHLKLTSNDLICPESIGRLDVKVHPKPDIKNKYDTLINCFELEPSYFIFPGAEETTSIYWPHADQYSHSIALTSPGDYYHIETTINGCIDTAFHNVRNRCEPELYIADAFTPNGDNVNDELRIFGYYHNLKVHFYNLYGEHLYTYNEGQKYWDGTSEGILVPNGTYLWVAEFEDKHGERFEKQGKVLIIR